MPTTYKAGDRVEFMSDGFHDFWMGRRVPVGSVGTVQEDRTISVIVDGEAVRLWPKPWGLRVVSAKS